MSKRNSNRKPKGWTAVLAPVVILIAILALLQILTVSLNINEHVLPQPINMIRDTLREFPNIWPHFLFTIKIVVLGFAISVPLGMLIAALLSQSRVLTNAFSPVILCLVITPMMTLIPIMLLWLGTNPNLRLLVIVVQATPVITLNTLNGFTNVEREKMELAACVGANKLQTFTKITFMNAMPQVFTGVKLGCINSTIGAIGADFVSGKLGMGTRITYYNKFNATSVSYGCIILVAIIGLVLYYVISAIEKRVILWKK